MILDILTMINDLFIIEEDSIWWNCRTMGNKMCGGTLYLSDYPL